MDTLVEGGGKNTCKWMVCEVDVVVGAKRQQQNQSVLVGQHLHASACEKKRVEMQFSSIIVYES